MRRPWILLLACVLAAPAGAKPRSKARAKAKAVKLRKIALTTLGDLAAERYAAVIKRLSPELEKNLTKRICSAPGRRPPASTAAIGGTGRSPKT